jgi:hypothetical protein
MSNTKALKAAIYQNLLEVGIITVATFCNLS